MEKAVMQQLNSINLTLERGVKKYGPGFYKFRESQQLSSYAFIFCFPDTYAESNTPGQNFFPYEAFLLGSGGQVLRPDQELKSPQDAL